MRAASMVTETPASVAGTVRHMAGVLWDNMLSEMNKSGLDSSTLGPGGDQFQSLFMWNIAQNDFSSYDTQLVQAALKQLGGQDASTSTATTNAPPAGTANQDIAVSAPLLPAAPARGRPRARGRGRDPGDRAGSDAGTGSGFGSSVADRQGFRKDRMARAATGGGRFGRAGGGPAGAGGAGEPMGHRRTGA
jgi:flagellar protein FlgJ